MEDERIADNVMKRTQKKKIEFPFRYLFPTAQYIEERKTNLAAIIQFNVKEDYPELRGMWDQSRPVPSWDRMGRLFQKNNGTGLNSCGTQDGMGRNNFFLVPRSFLTRSLINIVLSHNHLMEEKERVKR